MFSSLTSIADKFSTLIREPVTPLGNAVHDAIYASGYSTSQFQKITDMVLSTSDPDALDEVWFVFSKAMGSSNNSDIRQALKLADYLIKHTGARFHNTCSPLFMRKLKEMILYKAKTGGADNMHLMNDARAMVRVWGEGFLPYASQGRGKVIVEGYQDMQRSGIRFPPAPNEEENKWVPMVSAPTSRSTATSVSSSSYYNSSSSTSGSGSSGNKSVSEVNPKELYRNVKRLLAKLDEEGLDFFENERAKKIVEDSRSSQKALMVMIDRETTRGEDENLLSHLLTLNDMCQQLSKLFIKYERKQAEARRKHDDWDDEPAKDDDWDDDAPKPARRGPRKPAAAEDKEPEVQVRSTRRRAAKAGSEAPAEASEPAAASSATDDLLGLGLWDEAPAEPAKPAKPVAGGRQARKPAADSWGFDEDEAPAPAPAAAAGGKRQKKVTVDDLFDDEPAPAAAPRRAAKKATIDDLFSDEEEAPAPAPAPRRAAKKASIDDLFDDEPAPAAAPRRSRKPAAEDWDDEPAPAPRRTAKKTAIDDLFDDEPAAAPAPRRARKPAADDWDDEPAAAPRRSKKPSRQPTADDWGFDDEPAPRRTSRQNAAPAPVSAPAPAPAPAAAPVDPFASMDFDFTKKNLTPAAPAPAAKKDVFDDLFSL